jgi:hypothetical protein
LAVLRPGRAARSILSVLGHRRDPVPELPIERDEVLDIIGGLADIDADTRAILGILREEDDEEETDES